METFLVNQIYTALSDFKPGYMVLVHYQKWKNSSQNIIRLTYFCYKNMALFINSPDPDIHNHHWVYRFTRISLFMLFPTFDFFGMKAGG